MPDQTTQLCKTEAIIRKHMQHQEEQRRREQASNDMKRNAKAAMEHWVKMGQ